jgi:citrate synthase
VVAALGQSRTHRQAAARATTLARAMAGALGGHGPRAVELIEQALVLCADHELNTSAFSARVAASSGADLYACLTAAFATLSGPHHGGASDRVEALLDEAQGPDQARMVVAERARRGERIPGFGHPLYPEGDPRAQALLTFARRFPANRRSRTVAALIAAMPEPPSLDLGLVAVRAALGLVPGAASALFAVGRAAGYVAHIFEQRRAGVLLRPRAHYAGVHLRPPGATRGTAPRAAD